MNAKRLALILVGVFIMAVALAPSAWAIVSGAAFTTVNETVDGTGHCQNGNPNVNCNLYDGKEFVWLNGGPVSASLSNGTYFFAVLEPGGQGGNDNPNDGTPKNLSDLPSGDAYTNRTFSLSGGMVSYSGTHQFANNKIRLIPYDDTTNSGGVYILAVCRIDLQSSFDPLTNTYKPATDPVTPDKCKYDAFKANKCVDANCNPGGNNKITACKYFDSDADGSSIVPPLGTDFPLAGWPMTISPLDGATPSSTLSTLSDGCVQWTGLDDNLYIVTEGAPTQVNWFNSEPGPNPTPLVAPTGPSQTVSAVGSASEVVNFGNFCTVSSGGLTLGFWSNKNGQALFTSSDLAFLANPMNLRNANGTNFDPASYTAFRTWLLSATATNMAYMLSAQLSAMELNVRHNKVDPGAFDMCSHMTIQQLMDAANASLGSNGLTLAGNLVRPFQESLKTCLDNLNNGGPVVPVHACAYSFSTP